jgi:hypothetical protein
MKNNYPGNYFPGKKWYLYLTILYFILLETIQWFVDWKEFYHIHQVYGLPAYVNDFLHEMLTYIINNGSTELLLLTCKLTAFSLMVHLGTLIYGNEDSSEERGTGLFKSLDHAKM